MLETAAVILIVVWLLGMISGIVFGNYIHILLVVAGILFIVRLLIAIGNTKAYPSATNSEKSTVSNNDDEGDDLDEGELDLSKATTKPVCPHCTASLDKIHYIALSRDVIYYCPLCKKILSITNDE